MSYREKIAGPMLKRSHPEQSRSLTRDEAVYRMVVRDGRAVVVSLALLLFRDVASVHDSAAGESEAELASWENPVLMTSQLCYDVVHSHDACDLPCGKRKVKEERRHIKETLTS